MSLSSEARPEVRARGRHLLRIAPGVWTVCAVLSLMDSTCGIRFLCWDYRTDFKGVGCSPPTFFPTIETMVASALLIMIFRSGVCIQAVNRFNCPAVNLAHWNRWHLKARWEVLLVCAINRDRHEGSTYEARFFNGIYMGLRNKSTWGHNCCSQWACGSVVDQRWVGRFIFLFENQSCIKLLRWFSTGRWSLNLAFT